MHSVKTIKSKDGCTKRAKTHGNTVSSRRGQQRALRSEPLYLDVMRSWQCRPQQQTQLSPSILSLVSTRPRTPRSKHHALLFKPLLGEHFQMYTVLLGAATICLSVLLARINPSLNGLPGLGSPIRVGRITRLIWVQSTLVPTEKHVWVMDSSSWLASEALTDLNLGSYLMAGNTGFLTHTMERWRSSSLHKVIRAHKCNNWKAQFRTNLLFILVP